MKKAFFPLLVVLSLLVLLILFVFYNRYRGYYEEEQINRYISKNIEILNENLAFEKRYALSLSLYISKNSVIKAALQNNDQKAALREMQIFLEEIRRTTGIRNIDVQIHTRDLRAFARNWDKSDYFGTRLGGFRKGLVQVKRTKEPLVSIELGKRLNIKAISPILDQNRTFVGSIEVIMGFQNMKQRLQKFGLEILGLLDEKFIEIAVDLRDHERIGRYYLVEKQYPRRLYQLLLAHKDILEQERYYVKIDQSIVVMIPMKSVGIEDVGMIVMAMDAKEPKDSSYAYRETDMTTESYTPAYEPREVQIR